MECCYFDLEKSTDLSTWKGRDQGTSDYTFLRKSTLFSKMFFKRWYVCTFAMWMLAHIFLILMRWWKQMIFWYSKKILEVLDLVKSSSILVGHGISKDMFCFVKPHFNLYTVEGTIWNLKRSEKLLFKYTFISLMLNVVQSFWSLRFRDQPMIHEKFIQRNDRRRWGNSWRQIGATKFG